MNVPNKGSDVFNWETQQAHFLQEHASVNWRPGRDVSGDPVIRIRFDGATYRTCPTRQARTSARAAPCQLTVRTQAHYEAIQDAHRRQKTAAFKAQYALRAGVEVASRKACGALIAVRVGTLGWHARPSSSC
jgi:Transposase DDE domain